VVDEVWYPRGTKFFTRDGKVMQGTKWGVHAYLVDGTVGFTERVENMLQKKREVWGKSQINMFKLGEGNKVEKEEDERIQGYSQKILEEYSGGVLSSKVPKDPPVRGLFGEARIDLIDGAIPVRQKPFVLHGERLEAHKKITQEWIDNGYIEPIPGGKENSEWLSMTFPVPKKGPGEWRGVVDM
jgi:hypothetical protein